MPAESCWNQVYDALSRSRARGFARVGRRKMRCGHSCRTTTHKIQPAARIWKPQGRSDTRAHRPVRRRGALPATAGHRAAMGSSISRGQTAARALTFQPSTVVEAKSPSVARQGFCPGGRICSAGHFARKVRLRDSELIDSQRLCHVGVAKDVTGIEIGTRQGNSLRLSEPEQLCPARRLLFARLGCGNRL